MADKTVEEIITEIQRELHQVAGPGVQLYSQDMLLSRLNSAYLTFFDDKEVIWKRFIEYATYVLDGTTGKATTDVSATFREYDHIFRVYPSQSDRPLTKWNMSRNPALITGNAPYFIKPTNTATKIFQVIPATATGSVVVVGKSLSALWPFNDLEQVVPFDYLALVYYVAWQELIDDDTNSSAAALAQQKFTNRYKQLEANQGQEPIAFNGGSSQIPVQWFDSHA